MSVVEFDTVVIGAGLLGSGVGMHLSNLERSSVAVLDFDLEGSLSSSELNAGGVRATWTQPINIQASIDSIQYYAKHAKTVGYRDCGYLWLHPEEKKKGALKALELQTSLGWEVESFGPDELKRRVEFIDKVDGISVAVFARRDGLLNPNLLRNHYREIAKSKGVVFKDRMFVSEILYEGSTAKILVDEFEADLSLEEKIAVLRNDRTPELQKKCRRIEIRAKRVVNCVGAWASHVSKKMGYECPSVPVRRQVCIFDCRDVDLSHYGMIVDTSGVYFHPEAMNGLSGFADDAEGPGVNFNYDGEDFFMNVIWPALYERSTKFERLKHLTGWAGLYEVSPDKSAIVGKVQSGRAGEFGNVFEAHSFSGHGAMHSYAASRAVAELMIRGRYETIDFSPLRGTRFSEGKEIRETLVI